VRELAEELTLKLYPQAMRYFTRFDFDLSFAGLPAIWRYLYEIKLDRAALSKLTLNEGVRMELFSAEAILTGAVHITPYDAFELWFHINRERLRQ
jgi:8-oxo-dGTP diphosphatase